MKEIGRLGFVEKCSPPLVVIGPRYCGSVERVGNAPTRAMRALLIGSVVLFGVVVTTQIAVHVGAAMLLGLGVAASETLLHTGGLDTETFATSAYLGIGAAALLAAGLAARAFVRRASGNDGSLWVGLRRDARIAAVGLLVALGAVALLGWHPSAYFPYPLATIVVFANLAFFALGVPIWLGATGLRATRWLFELGDRSQYLSGAMTAVLVVLSVAGVVSAGYERALIADEVADRKPLRSPTSLAEASEEGLCLVADTLQPALAQRSRGCEVAIGDDDSANRPGGRPSDDCSTTLHDGPFINAQSMLSRQFGLSSFDANEVATHALMITCTREPSPADLGAYFWTVARREAARYSRASARLVSCDEEILAMPDACTTSDSEEIAGEKAAELWQRLDCELGPRVTRVIRLRFEQNLSFAEIGARIRVSEDEARNTLHNALKKVRRLGIAECFRE